MDPVKRQYEAYPYPERDPGEETARLITGSPSHPREIDHFLFRGARDWSLPFRALVAGGGTGDGLIMLAQVLADAGCPAAITYLDLSTASRAVAEARAAARGLTSIRFETGGLLDAARYGPFDYIDCCGVLHHLPDPQEGFDALAAALAPEGGMGLMVYGPYGRTGVYEMQAALRALCADDPPEAQVACAKKLLAEAPASNWLLKNDQICDHKTSDAGLYDLLLHSRDRAFSTGDVHDALDRSGLGLVSFLEAARYQPDAYLTDPDLCARAAALSPREQAAFCERLAGNLRTHVFYAARAERVGGAMAGPGSPNARPRLSGAAPAALASQIERTGAFRASADGLTLERRIPQSAAPLITQLDGSRTLGQIAVALGRDWFAFARAFAPVHRALSGINMLHYSQTFA